MMSSSTQSSNSAQTIVGDDEPEDAATRGSILKGSCSWVYVTLFLTNQDMLHCTGVAGYIIVQEFCERLAYYGFAGSLVLFFQNRLNMSNADADVQFSLWAGACYVTPLLGGYIGL